jgi:hypothetical protein
MDIDMIDVHTPSGTVISPTLISPQRYKLLYAAHSLRARPEAITHDLLKLLARYHPRAKSLKPQGRKLKLANHLATMPTLQHALESTFLSYAELFGSPLNCSMPCGISHCSAFPEDVIFGAITDSFLYRWTGSYIASPEYELEDMLKTVLHALSSPESQGTPFLVVCGNLPQFVATTTCRPSSRSRRGTCGLFPHINNPTRPHLSSPLQIGWWNWSL